MTEVEVAGDLAHAKIFFVTHGDPAEANNALSKAAGFLRSQLARRLMMRTVPHLHFVYDDSIDRGMHLSALIDQAVITPPDKS